MVCKFVVLCLNMVIQIFLLLFLITVTTSGEKCLEREDYYFKLLKPEYNTSLNPSATMSGRKHSEETKTKTSEANKGENNAMFGKTGDSHPRFFYP